MDHKLILDGEAIFRGFSLRSTRHELNRQRHDSNLGDGR
jgi:hypothetical protein